MPKPMTKKTLEGLKEYSRRLYEDGFYEDHSNMNALIVEVERLQNHAKTHKPCGCGMIHGGKRCRWIDNGRGGEWQ